MAVGTTNGDRVLFTHGMANLELQVAVSADTRFRTASVSKWLTAVAALKLEAVGKLALDAPIQDYCPQYPVKQWRMTTRELLNHTAGVRHYITLNGENPETDEQRALLNERDAAELSAAVLHFDSVIDALDIFKHDPLLYKPGTQQHYTSPGYRVLGCVISGANGTSYNQAMQELVFDPARMTATTMDDTTRLIPGRAAGYRRTTSGKQVPAEYVDLSGNVPAGGHLSTPDDLVNFGLSLLEGKLLSEKSLNLMSNGSLATALTKRIQVGPINSSHYASGVMVVEQGEHTLWYHSGAQPGARSMLAVMPNAALVVAIQVNDEGVNRAQLVTYTSQIIASITGVHFNLLLR